MFKWNANNIINATNGKISGNWLGNSNVSIDTRTTKKGDLFIALEGKNFDGHNFLDEAFSRGATAAVVSKKEEYKKFPLIIVKDTLKALQDMASFYIKNVLVNAKVITITGSVGKTTTKDMLHTVLSRYGVSHANKGNLNNNIGLPFTVLKAPENCRYLILEIGMSRFGEIKELSKISNPDVAVITNIEPVHTENFSSLLNVAQAKLEVLHGMKNNGTLILNMDNQYYDYLLSNSKRNIISFGKNKNATVSLLESVRKGNILNLKIKTSNNQIVDCNLHSCGEHFAYSILVVAAVLQSFKLDLSQIPLALENFTLTEGRGNIYYAKYNEKLVHLINDSYNASPTSVRAAIRALGAYSPNLRKIALLGDMLELGSESIVFHRELLYSIREQNVSRVYTVGTLMLELHKLLPEDIRGMHFDSVCQLKSNLDSVVQNNDVVLIKGSRLIRMDKILQDFVIL